MMKPKKHSKPAPATGLAGYATRAAAQPAAPAPAKSKKTKKARGIATAADLAILRRGDW
jgi:hypothetical protein